MARSKGRKKANSTFGSRTDVGCVRDHNEDSLAVAPPLYVVCDGMGGHAAGEVASEIAVDVISQRSPDHADAAALGQAVEEANLAVIKAAREGVGRAGMGCTCTAAILEKERLVIAQVGDSRAYLLHQGKLQQLTRDHSLVADLIEAGQITEAEARVHPQRSVITRALGSDPRTQPDLFEINVEAGDRLLLCSDGLSTMLEDPEIEKILKNASDPQRCAAQLVNEANGLGGYDNVTVIVVDVTGLAEQRQRKMTRRARATAIMLGVLLVAVLAGCVYGFNYLATNSAYLVDQNGKVAIYQGVPGELFGFSAHKLVRATEVSTDDLQPGTANRLREEGIKVDNLDAAESLVKEYETEIAERRTADEAAAAQAAAAGQQSGSADAPPSSDGAVPGGAQPDGGAPTSGDAAPADESAQPAATPAADPAQPAR
ncbi:Stp1/IreP family PP2C-type Ser/Thr phosphatase [Adlercreutzia caecimuris]|jgi:serine/threonine protein phosphatase PrpC|uniref:Stp1/IreP family PP2C-type Ser/Thr phosphatase n=1 Tax=Adlercreutzia caecimuris TaxID=671266 RepID=A0A4V3WUQ5_9ACTN|nr:Stp1/IreP family PP2C-type Ser/Thr phosphatase [Adlercreutzia caecimuris]MCI9207696.1 Stp1/IreP family PP2C-type Ser/Thr phosphatase [Adlercreutzia caecimuris]NBJ65587.1 Stp1/IreP family PP2C-type Ser/Thr phosphatase [Adlercreutzia caecimuris]THG36777.1 Stp1/IreP family PP2C-type Ser/Thr phosphatase [Adlercreutzia caecimuris]